MDKDALAKIPPLSSSSHLRASRESKPAKPCCLWITFRPKSGAQRTRLDCNSYGCVSAPPIPEGPTFRLAVSKIRIPSAMFLKDANPCGSQLLTSGVSNPAGATYIFWITFCPKFREGSQKNSACLRTCSGPRVSFRVQEVTIREPDFLANFCLTPSSCLIPTGTAEAPSVANRPYFRAPEVSKSAESSCLRIIFCPKLGEGGQISPIFTGLIARPRP